MAKIKKMPSKAIISGFRGLLDFYVWKGIPCVRSWPRSPGHHRTPAVESGWPAFTWAAKNWKNLPLEIKEAYNQMAVSTHMTGKDIFVKTYITSAFFELE